MAININVTRSDDDYDAQLLLGFKGDTGKSAYEYAVDGGYEGTETDFLNEMARLTTAADEAAQSAEDAEAALNEFVTVTATAETLPAGSDATATYADGELTFGIPKGDKGDQGDPYDDSAIVARMDSFTNLAEGSTTGDAELIDGRVGADGVTYTNIGGAIRGQVTDLKAEINDIASTFTVLNPYLYKKNKYINGSGVETDLNGYDLYKIPLNDYDLVSIKWDTAFWGGLTAGCVFSIEDEQGIVTNIDSTGMQAFLRFKLTSKELLMLNNGNYVALFVSAQAGSEGNAILAINAPFADDDNPHTHKRGVYDLSVGNAVKSAYYLRTGETPVLTTWTSGFYSYFVPVKSGDKVGFTDDKASGLSNRGIVRYNDGTHAAIADSEYFTFTDDGIACLYLGDTSEKPVFYPADSIRIEAKNVISEAEIDMAEVKLDSVVSDYTIIDPYLYKTDVYINSSGVEVALAGHNLYKVPFAESDFLQIKWTAEDYAGGLSVGNAYHLVGTDDSIINLTGGFGQTNYELPNSYSYGESVFKNDGSYKAVIFSVSSAKTDYVRVYKNTMYPKLDTHVSNGAELLSAETAIRSQCYIQTTGKFNSFFTIPNYYSLFKKVKAGDKVLISGSITGLSYAGLFIDEEDNLTQIATSATEYTAPSDGLLMVFINTTMTKSYMFCPANSIKIEGKNIINFNGGDTQFQGKNGVAFGTSLTYRAISSYGYLTKLAELSGITFDNQGIGSSVIKGNMLTAIKNYSSYANKDICVLEGFVNDWYQNLPLGTWKDTTEDTVCGCVRVAFEYMLSQNANMTVFLILDHYGKNVSNVDCSTLAVNGSGLTQFEYYSEIARVAESMGIPVIREFEDSQISENTPQYLADNIHLNALGAVQSGTVIWYQMKQYSVNVQ